MRILLALATLLLPTALLAGEFQALQTEMQHLRIDGPAEWSEFDKEPDAAGLKYSFKSQANETEWTLRLRQQDVKEAWQVTLNGKSLGTLFRDENDMVIYLPVPKGVVRAGENELEIAQDTRRQPKVDDIVLGQMVLYEAPRDEVLGAATLNIQVLDADTKSKLPARITIVHDGESLHETTAVSNDSLAVRPGTIYTARGEATCGVPAGRYTVYAGRGFEYSLASQTIELQAGETKNVSLSIRREVPTAGYVACDTHVHTLTHSGHGDSTVQERMITLAAEGIELPIATDHNVQIDHEPFAREMHVRKYFTPVIGNEVTTPVGHFNIFPAAAGAKTPEFRLSEWSKIFDSIYATPGVKVAILNHARDIHAGVRPFGPALFNDVSGENLDGWAMRFNAMEVVNSSSNQNDNLRLFLDWMALLNRGRSVTPVGSSDSHDVARHFVGQGRTYIRCDDRDPGNIDVDLAVQSFLAGKVVVSYGLMSELVVSGKYRSGELAQATGEESLTLSARVLGPHWVSADKVSLYANGQLIREEDISESRQDNAAGVLWSGEWQLPQSQHDVHYVLIATGPGITAPYWRTAKPHQPTSPHFVPTWIGCSGAVWFDGDRDGQPTPARTYAERLVAKHGTQLPELLGSLASYDEAVAEQAAQLLTDAGISPLDKNLEAELKEAAKPVQAGFADYFAAWRRSQLTP